MICCHNRGEERNGEKNSIDFNMKSSSSEESVRKRSHSVGGNQFANTLTAANICDINIDNLDTKQDLIGECKRRAIKIMEWHQV